MAREDNVARRERSSVPAALRSDRAVVPDDELVVGAEMQVELDAVNAQRDRCFEARERALGTKPTRASVTVHFEARGRGRLP